MAHIGSRKHAQFILDWYFNDRPEGMRLPEGWQQVGRGFYRIAFRHVETNVIYKVERTKDHGGFSNRGEVRAAQRLSRQKFSHVRIPATSGYSLEYGYVVAMENVKGDSGPAIRNNAERHFDALMELFKIGFSDMHHENFFIDAEGRAVPIDMGSGISRHYPDYRVLIGTKYYEDLMAERRKAWSAWGKA